MQMTRVSSCMAHAVLSVLGLCSVGLVSAQTAAFTTVNAPSDEECFYGWAEAQLPSLLTPSPAKTNLLGNLTYRAYTASGIYLGIDGGKSVLAMGGPVGSEVKALGFLTDFIGAARASTCGATTLPVQSGRLADTGVSQCFEVGNSITLLSCTAANAVALNSQQDGMRGWDVDAPDPVDGRLGFSYSAVAGGCVRDNVTQLTWEVKTRDGGLRDINKSYTHFGDSRAGDASAYVAQVNAAQLCGFSDWRLPNPEELHSLVDYGVAYPGPMVDSVWFPNSSDWGHWAAGEFVSRPEYGWQVTFSRGYIEDAARSAALRVRLVRGTGLAHTQYRFSTDGSEVTDSKTGLIWKRCSEGQTWGVADGAASASCNGTVTQHSLEEALVLAASAKGGWRLPNVKEIASLADRSRYNRAINLDAFPNTSSLWYWSSTPHAGTNPAHVMAGEFVSGRVTYFVPSQSQVRNVVRLVRATAP